MRLIATQIHHCLRQAKSIIIIPHQNPDGDALGAATALAEYLHVLAKDHVIFCATALPPKRWHFLRHAERVTNDPSVFKQADVDTIVVLDSGDLAYAGVAHLVAGHPATIINIDHHATNQNFGHHNLVLPTAPSTTAIIYHLFKHAETKLNKSMATSLLTGLITDTDSFTNAATSADALAIAGELIRHGADLALITGQTIKNKTLGALRLWGTVLSRLEKHLSLDLIYTYITRDDLIKHNLSDTESEGIANFLNNLEGAKIALILKETPDGKIKGSFRTTRDDVDVSALAKKLGGGGHKKAAGFTIDGTIKEIVEKVAAIQETKDTV